MYQQAVKSGFYSDYFLGGLFDTKCNPLSYQLVSKEAQRQLQNASHIENIQLRSGRGRIQINQEYVNSLYDTSREVQSHVG